MARKLSIAAVLLVCAAYFLLQGDPEAGTGLAYTDVVEPGAPPAEESEAEIVERAIEAPADAMEEPAFPAPNPAGSITVRGRVLRIDGAGLAAVRVVHSHPFLRPAATTTAADGSFAIQVEEAHGELALDDPRWALLGGELQLGASAREGYALIAAPALRLRGRVVDEEGASVGGADVRAVAPSDALVIFGFVSTPLEHEGQRARSAADGSFELASVPGIDGLVIEATAEGRETSRSVLLSPFPSEVSLRLRRAR